jgi:hypothetical protein
MGVIDTVTEEITKWLLNKVDDFLSKRESTYKNRAEFLYEVLFMIDDQVSILRETLFPKEIRFQTRISNSYMDAAQILNDIKFIAQKTIEVCPDEYWYDIVLHSNEEKSFWDGLRQYLASLESNARGLYWDSYNCGLVISGPSRSFEKEERLKEEIELNLLESSDELQRFINALKDDINCYSVDAKTDT